MENSNKKTVVFFLENIVNQKNVLNDFIKFCVGIKKFYIDLIPMAQIIVASKFRLLSKEILKQEIFYHFFVQKDYKYFLQKCDLYKQRLDEIVNKEAKAKITEHIAKGEQVILISSEIAEIITPWAQSLGITNIHATEAEIDEQNRVHGKLKHLNYKNKETLNKLLDTYRNDSEKNQLYLYHK